MSEVIYQGKKMNLKIFIFVILGIIATCKGWMDGKERRFKEKFLFGVGSSAYQTEGAWDEDGRGESIWDKFIHDQPDRVVGNATGDIACDSYHLFERDVEMLRELGVKFYRFSISWPRIFPTGTSESLNRKAIKFYDALIDELVKYKIIPVVTLYHWDLPQALQEKGGWLNPDTVKAFQQYADMMFVRYAAWVKLWITFNQPNTICVDGYGTGMTAPGLKGKADDVYLCIKHVLLAHAHVYSLYETKYRYRLSANSHHEDETFSKQTPGAGEVGIALSINWFDPITNSTEHKEKAEEMRQFAIGMFAQPIFSIDGDFPDVVKEKIAKRSRDEGLEVSRLPKLSAEEINLIKNSADFLAVNHYTTYLVEEGSEEEMTSPIEKDVGVKLTQSPQWKPSKAVWLKSAPYGLYKSLLWLNKAYEYPKMLISENGWASSRGLEDNDRVEYIRHYLDALLLAIEDGSHVIGYAYWSLMDNFEWVFGFEDRFGLYEVDFESDEKTRTARLSAFIYKNIIKTKQVDHKYVPEKGKKMSIVKKSKREEL